MERDMRQQYDKAMTAIGFVANEIVLYADDDPEQHDAHSFQHYPGSEMEHEAGVTRKLLLMWLGDGPRC
jgi:hypothetical protein